MDPQQTWKEILDAWAHYDWEQVAELAEALLTWLQREGFPPDVEYPRELGTEFNTVIVTAACEFARYRAANILADPHHIPRDVPFTLSCSQCNNEGPASDELARSVGWARIQYVPASMSENFLGICPICR